MSRWKSPQIAAKRAQRAEQQAEQLRKEKRNSWLMIIGFILLSTSLVIADYFWLKARARQRRERHMQTHHRPAQTNTPAAAVTLPANQTAPTPTNHE